MSPSVPLPLPACSIAGCQYPCHHAVMARPATPRTDAHIGAGECKADLLSIIPEEEHHMQIATHRTLHVTEDQLEMLTQGLEEGWPTLDYTSEELYELHDKLTALANEFGTWGADD